MAPDSNSFSGAIVGSSDLRLFSQTKEQGYIDFEIEEPIIELDSKTGKTIAIKNRIRLSSEILIEILWF